MTEGRSVDTGTVFGFSFPEQPWLFSLCVRNVLWSGVGCLFSPRGSGRAVACMVDPKSAYLCYSVFACLLSGGSLAGRTW